MGLSMALTQMFVAPRVVARLGERRAAMVGLLGGSTVMGFIAVNEWGWLTFVLMPCIAIQSFVHPCLTAMMSRRARANNQGEVQGFSSSVMAVGSVIAPLLYNPLHAHFSAPDAPVMFHGAAFAVAAAIGLTAFAMLTRVKPANAA
jgi:DHA1 family tetracycline resistance protein-like MFS transporter